MLSYIRSVEATSPAMLVATPPARLYFIYVYRIFYFKMFKFIFDKKKQCVALILTFTHLENNYSMFLQANQCTEQEGVDFNAEVQHSWQELGGGGDPVGVRALHLHRVSEARISWVHLDPRVQGRREKKSIAAQRK